MMRKKFWICTRDAAKVGIILVLAAGTAVGVLSAGIRPLTRPAMDPQTLTGIASWYSEKDPGIRGKTAGGEFFEDSKKTCASWDFSLGTYLEVMNRENGKTIICRVNDRGPDRRLNRRIDLSKKAFRSIGSLHQGVIPVTVKPAARNRT